MWRQVHILIVVVVTQIYTRGHRTVLAQHHADVSFLFLILCFNHVTFNHVLLSCKIWRSRGQAARKGWRLDLFCQLLLILACKLECALEATGSTSKVYALGKQGMTRHQPSIYAGKAGKSSAVGSQVPGNKEISHFRTSR